MMVNVMWKFVKVLEEVSTSFNRVEEERDCSFLQNTDKFKPGCTTSDYRR
jgi:hypothetical protein